MPSGAKKRRAAKKKMESDSIPFVDNEIKSTSQDEVNVAKATVSSQNNCSVAIEVKLCSKENDVLASIPENYSPKESQLNKFSKALVHAEKSEGEDLVVDNTKSLAFPQSTVDYSQTSNNICEQFQMQNEDVANNLRIGEQLRHVRKKVNEILQDVDKVIQDFDCIKVTELDVEKVII